MDVAAASSRSAQCLGELLIEKLRLEAAATKRIGDETPADSLNKNSGSNTAPAVKIFD